MSNKRGWIGVDLDATLAEYHGWKGPEHIGEPIPLMVERVKRWLVDDRTVKIFTARISHDGTPERRAEAETARLAIIRWLSCAGLPLLEITNVKDHGMIELWDDRCVQVIANTGEPVGTSTRGLA